MFGLHGIKLNSIMKKYCKIKHNYNKNINTRHILGIIIK